MSDYPEGYQGAGPMFAAVPLGDPWYNLAVRGSESYVVEVPTADPERVDGWAFLDRGQAEEAADAHADGELIRYAGLCGWNDATPAREEAERQALAELEAGDEWDSADSNAYQAQQEAEAGQ